VVLNSRSPGKQELKKSRETQSLILSSKQEHGTPLLESEDTSIMLVG
jgi:hypothetical protein